MIFVVIPFLKWQPCHFPVMALCFVELIFVNVFSINLLVVLSLISFFIVDSLAVALNSLGLFIYIYKL